MLTLPSQPKATKYIVCELATEQASYNILPQSHKSQEKITAHIFHRSCKKKQKFIIYIYIPSPICILWH